MGRNGDSKTTTGDTKLRDLTVKQENAIDVLVNGATDREAAEAVGVHRVTITNWRNHHPWFAAELNRRRRELWTASADRIRSLIPIALDALEDELRTGRDRARTAVEVLRLVGLDRVGGKQGTMEHYLVGPTTPEAILDDYARALRPDPVRELLDGAPITSSERDADAAHLSALAS